MTVIFILITSYFIIFILALILQRKHDNDSYFVGIEAFFFFFATGLKFGNGVNYGSI